MSCVPLVVVLVLFSGSALAQAGAAAPPGTPGTSLGSGQLEQGRERRSAIEMCERLSDEREKERCLRARPRAMPGAAGPLNGVGGDAATGASPSRRRSGTAPGPATR